MSLAPETTPQGTNMKETFLGLCSLNVTSVYLTYNKQENTNTFIYTNTGYLFT